MVVYVTHDQVEAMTLGQRVAVMRDGHMLQVDTPQTLYEHPRDLFVAGFIGSPAMNLVDARIEGGEVVLGQFRIPLAADRRPGREAGRVILGIRPETFEDAAFASPDLPAIDTEVVVLEELGSDAHVFFRVDASRVAAGLEDDADEATDLVTDRGSLLNARVDPRTRARVGDAVRLSVTRPASTTSTRTRACRCSTPPASPKRGRRLRSRSTPTSWIDQSRVSVTMTRVTKQAETRDLVLDLIEPLAVGEAIPSERQLSADFGVSRLTVRAALDDLVREGHLVRRHGSGTFVERAEDRAGAHDDLVHRRHGSRGLSPASETLDLRTVMAGARLGRLLHVSPSEPVLVAERLRLADGESMAIETVHIRASRVPGLTARDLEERSFYELLHDRYGIVVVGGEQTIEPTVTDEDESRALGVPLHSPAFRFERVTHSEEGEIVEFVESIYRGDRYRLITALSIPPDRRRTRTDGRRPARAAKRG